MALARDLVNTAPSDLPPAALAAEAERVAAAAGLDAEVLDEKALAERGYGGILGVGQGSVNPPRLVRLEYAPPNAARTVVFVGKGITFDSGGLSLKPPKSMETMKSDMGGAAAIIGAMQAIAALGPAVRVVGYLPLAENMPSGTAQRPSDVLTMYGGKTVEVLNTDAEGRLVLADALARSAADEPDVLVDVATLTGAQVVALGPRIAGVMANDDGLRDAVVDAAAPGRRGGLGHAAARRTAQGPGLDDRRPGQRGAGPRTAGCWWRACSCASSCRRACAGPTWTSPARHSMTVPRTGIPPRAARARQPGHWCRSRWTPAEGRL